MKKLLSLLSVLTISGTAVPTTIAASPYQKENNNNNLRETMELDSNISNIISKRENNKININVNKINDFSEIKEIIKKIEYNNKIYLLARNYITYGVTRSFLYEIKNNFFTTIDFQEVNNINDFCIDSNGNIYIATDLGLYKHDKYDIKSKISNIKIDTIGVDNEGKIVFKTKKEEFEKDEDYDINILTKDEVKNFPKERTDLVNIKKIRFNSTTPGGYTSSNVSPFRSKRFYFDKYNNLYILSEYNDFYISHNYTTECIKISNITNVKDFYAFGDKIYIFTDKKLYTLKTGQTLGRLFLSFSEINDYVLDSSKNNFYIATNNGIYKLNILDDEEELIFNSPTNKITIKITIDNSNNIFYILKNKNEIFILRNNISNEINFTNAGEHWSIARNANTLKPFLLFSINKKIYFIRIQDVSSQPNLYLFEFKREKSWISDEESYVNNLLDQSEILKNERLDKERLEKLGQLSEQQKKQWQIEKLEELKNKLEERKNNNKATSFEIKLLACLRDNISTGFSLGFGVLGGFAGSAAGTALAPGGGTVAFGMTGAAIGSSIGGAIGKWLGSVLGDFIQSSVPQGEAKCSL